MQSRPCAHHKDSNMSLAQVPSLPSRVDNGLNVPNFKFCPGMPHDHWMTNRQTDTMFFETRKLGLTVFTTKPVKMARIS